MIDIYKDNMWMNARKPEELGRKDWNHNPEGKVDYLPLGVGGKPTGNEVPLEKQKYNYGYESGLEQGASNLAAYWESKPDWKEYNRIMRDFN